MDKEVMMRIAKFPQAEPDADVWFREITREDRARVGGPALRTFRGIADAWSLSERERIAVLGEPGRSTYHQWMRKAQAREPVTLPLDTLLRLSGVFGVWKALAILFEDGNQGLAWLRGAHRGTVFNGASPMTFITEGALDGILTVRRYLDAWRGGEAGQGAPEGSFEPVTEADVIFV
ncbi:MAG: MbcA/ParS/Xre antitoxin family protein [Paracoccaceae bacterium]